MTRSTTLTPKHKTAVLAQVMQRLGLTAPPTYETRLLAPEVLVVVGERQLQRQATPFAGNLSVLGMLQAPVVVEEDDGDHAHRYRVVAGRRRVLAAKQLGLAQIECRVYGSIDAATQALLVLSENMRRSPAWIEELRCLVELVQGHIGLTEQELAVLLGLPISTVRERLKVARLPVPLLEQVLAGQMTQEVARRCTRLGLQERQALAQQAQAGKPLTANLIKETLRAQISLPLQQALSDDWTLPPVALPAAFHPAALERAEGSPGPGAAVSVQQVTETLETLQRQLAARPCPQTRQAQLLTQALLQALAIAAPVLTVEEVPA